jgi:DNA-directed RNA polymerase specialized sigma24 family protein
LVRQEDEGNSDGRSDAQLLASVDNDPDAFAVFYERHVAAIDGYVLRLTANEEVTFDMTTEIFATALRSSGRLRLRRRKTREWLLGIADETLAYSYYYGGVKDTARRRLGVPVHAASEDDWEAVADRIRNASDGPLRRVATLGAPVSIRGALSRRLSREPQ